MAEEELIQPNTLVLAMAYLTESEYKLSIEHVKNGTASAPARDAIRLIELEQLDGDHIIPMTWNEAQRIGQCVEGRHYQGYYSRRGVESLHEHVRDWYGENFSFSYVMLDYIRMYGGYFEKVYSNFEKEVMPRLYELGLVNNETKFYLPNRDGFWELLKHQVKPINYGAHYYTYNVAYLDAISYPLYQATHNVEERYDEKEYMCISNDYNLRTFEVDWPFLCVQMKHLDQPKKKRKNSGLDEENDENEGTNKKQKTHSSQQQPENPSYSY